MPQANVKSSKPIFYLIAFLLPVLLLALVEGALRLANYGKTIPVFVDAEAVPGYMQPNPELILRYFAAPELAPNVSPDTVYFPKKKGEGVFRIVIQGGSTAAGFPYGRFGSMQGMLEQRFKRLYPNKHIEVINTAMAAVNSYTLLDIADEILAIEPDLVLVYTGHNEYLGVLGAGSTFSPKGGRFATLAYLSLKELRLYQLLEQAFVASQLPDSTEVKQQADSDRSLMSKVAKGKQIPIESELYHLGVEQFKGNLQALVEVYQDANVPVVLGNLVSNEADLAPFSSVGKVDWEKTKQKLAAQQAVNEIDLEPEAKAYIKGLKAVALNQPSPAFEAFKQARDLDQLRFRAPSIFNQIIEQLTQQNGVTLADVDKQVRADTVNGIIGEKHMLEHVHPTKRGYFLLAEAFVETIVREKYIADTAMSFPLEKAWMDNPLTELDDRWAKVKIEQLVRDYPFRTEAIPMSRLSQSGQMDIFLLERLQGKDWLKVQNDLQRYYHHHGQTHLSAKVAGVLSDAMANSAKAANNAAIEYRILKDYPMSVYYLNRALRLKPYSAQYLMNQAHNKFLLQEYDASLLLLEQARKHGNSKQRKKALSLMERVKQAS